MMKDQVKTTAHALLYLTDCTLATVIHMAGKKSRNKHEFQRQIAMAQQAVNWIKDFHVNVETDSRVADILALPDQKVETWVKQYVGDTDQMACDQTA